MFTKEQLKIINGACNMLASMEIELLEQEITKEAKEQRLKNANDFAEISQIALNKLNSN